MIVAIVFSMKKLPENCSECVLVYDDMYCTIMHETEAEDLNYHGRRPAGCPLFEVK